uniref:Srp40 C-terminal domain-containing protein n=2 Tax=Magallana gigas TaxID=29159 RepID=A0A8W8JDN2_MAGGI
QLKKTTKAGAGTSGKAVNAKKKADSSSSDSSSSDSNDSEGGSKKKTPATKSKSKAPTTSTPITNGVVNGFGSDDDSGVYTSNKKSTNTPFRRVQAEKIAVDPRVADNSFEAKRGASGSWGERANRDLKYTQGKSFRHEKTKKKRGSYAGGAIDTNVYSIRFDSE